MRSVIGAYLDITELRQAQNSLHQALEQLLETDRRKNEFLAMLGHELRNPLAPIQNAAEFLSQRGLNDPTFQRPLAIILRQVAHMSRLVDDLLDVSRLILGRISLRRQPLRLAEVVDEALEVCQSALETRKHKLSAHVPGDLFIDGDKARLVQVITNLLNNAIKFTPPAGFIAVDATQDEDWVKLTVKDSGIGLCSDAQSKVFDLFMQEHPPINRAQGGLGIGLTLAKRLVEVHDGLITVKSEGPDKGAEFEIKLPRLRLPVEPAANALGPHRKSGHHPVLLIVEDNADTADTFQMMLQANGHKAHIARNGAEALQLIQELDPDIIFMDHGLPGIDGYSVARRLQAEHPHPPDLIAISGYGQQEDKRKAREAGFAEHLTKPVTWPQIESVLVNYRAISRASMILP